ncbi:hypothetical protein [Curtobacterium sp. MCBD17_032]|uniref:hypothetical protein n=1 Tax=Curtobacterium sp. MCBD17_032 TaxID=2175659 RepID=UPI000DAA1E5F|nr:hypothetical protein [Curtobacterium sp. MCBD17_032]PZE85132.1 hypothetical protein DEI91_06790 [Curtobacterium sp. MCBD17_032]
MDATMRAPWRAVLRWALIACGTGAAVVLLSVLLGARPAAAAGGPLLGAGSSTAVAPRSDGLVGGVVSGVGGAAQRVTSGVGDVVDRAVAPVRSAVPAPAAPALRPVAPAPAPVAPAPAPVAPAPVAPAPAPVAPAPVAPAPVASAPAASAGSAPAAPAPAGPAPTAPTPSDPAASDPRPAYVGPSTSAPAEPLTRPDTPLIDGIVSGAADASRPVTDAVSGGLVPVTGTAQAITAGGPVASIVATVDRVVGSLPVVGALLGDDTVGGLTDPLTDVVDGTLGTVGDVVADVPDAVAEVPGVIGGLPSVGGVLPGGPLPVVDLPVGPVLPGSGSALPEVPVVGPQLPGTPVLPVDREVVVLPEDGRGLGADARLTTDDAPTTSAGADRRATTTADVASRTTAEPVTTDVLSPVPAVATLGGVALVLPDGGAPIRLPFDSATGGTVGGSAAGGSAGANVLGTVGAEVQTSPLAAGLRGPVTDDAVPASLVGDHDVAPD